MGKYIIEIPDDKIGDFVGSTHFLMPYMMAGHIGHHDTGLPIELYTEPDLEQVRKEAYEEGKKQAKVQAELDVSHDIEKVARENYKAGLSDAWEAARKIIRMPEVDLLNLFTECYSAVCTSLQVFLKYDASECIEKIRQYEQDKEEINVGDEVIYNGRRCVVISPETTEKYGSVMDAEGGRHGFENGEVEKTGRHFPEIATVLDKMSENA